MTAQCPYCGAAAKPNSSYCASCGQLLAAETPVVAPTAAAFPPPIGGAPRPGAAPGAVPVLPPLPPLGPRPPVPLPAPIGADPAASPAPPAPAPPTPAPEPVPAAPIARPATLHFPDGTQAPLQGQFVLGRNPSGEGMEGHTMLALDDPHKMLSRSHLAIDARGARVTAMDLGSANGTMLVRGGTATRLGARLPVILEPGDTLVIGSLQLAVA